MKTGTVMLETLCVPCANRCRYCLLSWDGRPVGADWDESCAAALRYRDWLEANRPEVRFDFFFGYSMEHPRLLSALDFLNSLGSVQGRMLQMDGMRFREGEELGAFLRGVKAHGVRSLNFTFYGTEAYHDRFAGRPGDFRGLVRYAEAAAELGFGVSCGMPLTLESAALAGELVSVLRSAKIEDIRLFVPHSEGRGRSLDPIRLTLEAFDALPRETAALLDRGAYRTEAEWLQGGFPEETRRALMISLTPENVKRHITAPVDELIAEAEALDEAYYSALPPADELAGLYGDRESTRLYSRRDLLDKYRKRFIKENGLSLYDVTDERQTGSRRF